MTAYTINGGATTNWDSLTGGSINATLDSYAISNNTTLLIDTDSYQCANHSVAFGSLDSVTYAGVGGTLRISGQNVRVIAYTGGTGNVPAIGAAITQGGVSATFLGVWSDWQVEPTASGAVMPATGFIKVKNKTGGSFAAGALTGIGATASRADVVGWIEVRGADTAVITVPRIGRFEVVGDWFELGTTTGVRAQVLTCPTTATVAGAFPAVWIETGPATGIYEQFTGVGSMVALATAPTDERGKMVWQTIGGIRIGSDGTNNVGFLPPSGCRVRIPNVILTCCTRTAAGSGIRVLPNVTLATRQEFLTTSAGDIDISHAVCQWHATFVQPFRAKITNSAISDKLIISKQPTPLDIDNVVIAPTQAQLNSALDLSSNFGGGVVQNTLVVRFSLAAGAYVCIANFNKAILFSNVKSQSLLNRSNLSSGAWTCTQNQDCHWLNNKVVGGRMVLVGEVRAKITSLAYADNFSGATTATNAVFALDLSAGCQGTVLTGFSSLVADSHPYNGIVQTINSYGLTIKEIGTFAAPYNMGTINACNMIINGLGNNDGIRMKRIYTFNTRTGPWSFINSDNDIVIENVFADYADASAMPGLNATIKGSGLLGSVTGQVAVYGMHWQDFFTSLTAGKVEVLCNEPTINSAAQCAVTAGAPKFNSEGSVLLTAVGAQVTWEMPYFAKGHTAFQNVAPTLTGANTANLTYQYQLDTGAGFGAVKTLNAANLFAETIAAAAGFKLRIIATCAVANAANLLTQIRVLTTTTSVAQSTNQYPLATLTATFTGLQVGSDAVVLAAGTSTILNSVDGIPGASFSHTYETAENVDVGFLKEGFVPFYIRNYPLSSVNASLPVAQAADRNFE